MLKILRGRLFAPSKSHTARTETARFIRDTGPHGRDAPVEELKVIDVAGALPRFRAFPDDTGIALEGDKRFARVGPILKLLDGHVVAGLAAGTAGEERPRDIDHFRRALALIEQRRAAPGTGAAG